MKLNLFKQPKGKKVTPKKKVVVVTEEVAPKVSVVDTKFVSGNRSMVLSRPYVSEKASRLEATNKYVFKVSKDANKPEIKKAIHARYGVTVTSINVINMPAKKKTVGRYQGEKAGYRKAIITVAKGETINLAK